jgi:hypothetical protein
MNIHFSQVERKSQVFSYLLAAFAVFTALMLTLSLGRHAGMHWSAPATSSQAIQTKDNHLPIAAPAPLPPAEQAQAVFTPEPAGTAPTILVPQAIPAPAPFMP